MALSVELLSHRPRLQQKAYEVGKDGLYAINKARFTKSSHQLFSTNANACTMLALNGGKGKNCLMHLAPEQQPISGIKKGLEKVCEKLWENMENAQDKITGILVGGRFSNAESIGLFDKIAKELEELEIPFSMIFGKHDNVAFDNIAVSGDKAVIWNSSFKDIKFPKNPSQDELEDILHEKTHEVVEFSKDVPIYLGEDLIV